MSVTTASGSKFYISTTVPGASVDTAGEYAALTWTEIGEVETLGRFGGNSNIVNFASLSDTAMRKSKGIRDNGNLSVVCGYDAFDVGQIAMRAAELTKFLYGFKIEAADKLDSNDTNSIFYFQAITASAEHEFGNNDQIIKTTFNVAISGSIITVASTVVT